MIDDLSGPARKGNTVTIQSGLKSATYAHLNPAQRQRYPAMDYKQQSDKATQLAQKKMLGIKGEGANAEILWAPKQALRLNPDGQPTGIKDDDNEQESHLVLAHELVHARRLVKGTSTAGSSSRYDPKSPAGKEEQRAVGIGKPSNLTRPSENSVRQELGFPLRTAYQKVDSESERAPSPPLQFGAQETNNNRNSDIDSDS